MKYLENINIDDTYSDYIVVHDGVTKHGYEFSGLIAEGVTERELVVESNEIESSEKPKTKLDYLAEHFVDNNMKDIYKYIIIDYIFPSLDTIRPIYKTVLDELLLQHRIKNYNLVKNAKFDIVAFAMNYNMLRILSGGGGIIYSE